MTIYVIAINKKNTNHTVSIFYTDTEDKARELINNWKNDALAYDEYIELRKISDKFNCGYLENELIERF